MSILDPASQFLQSHIIQILYFLIGTFIGLFIGLLEKIRLLRYFINHKSRHWAHQRRGRYGQFIKGFKHAANP